MRHWEWTLHMMFSIHYQLDWVYKHLRDKPLMRKARVTLTENPNTTVGHRNPWVGILNWEKGEDEYWRSSLLLDSSCSVSCSASPCLYYSHAMVDGICKQWTKMNPPIPQLLLSEFCHSSEKKNKLIYGAFLFFKNFSISIKQSIITKEYFFILNISSKKRKRYVQCSRKSDSIGRQIDLHEKKKSNEHVRWILSKIHNYMVSHINDYAKNITILGITP